jgi:nitrogen fixation protein NifB
MSVPAVDTARTVTHAVTHAVTRGHPCFDEEAHERVGRVHLPVAPRCNIGCLFCERRICANLTAQHPGWTRRLLSPGEALDRVCDLVCSRQEERFVVGVAGPGEPLANADTFEALRLVGERFPHLTLCASTNGLLLEEKLSALLDVGLQALTVTVNAPDGEIGERIYGWVRYDGTTCRGREAADLLVERQMQGIRAALAAGLAVKVNTVLVPGVNDQHIAPLARRLQKLGVHLMNIMPLIPGGQMSSLRPPTCEELQQAREACGALVQQFHKCEQCRADVIRFPRSGGVGGWKPETFAASTCP